jgi:hypothetical protein
MEITRNEVIQILKQHGWEPTSPTAALDGEWCEGTDFDSEMGISEWYDLQAIRDWLGY